MKAATATAAAVPSVFTESRAIAAFIELGDSPAGRQVRRRTTIAYHQMFPDLRSWSAAPMTRRLGTHVDIRTLVAFLITATYHRVEVEYVRVSGSAWGRHLAAAHPRFAASFHVAATGIGFGEDEAGRQWRTLAKILAVAAVPPPALDGEAFHFAVDALTAAHAVGTGRTPTSWSTPLHGLKATLTSMGIIAAAPPSRLSPASRLVHWQALSTRSPQLAQTLRRYLAQIAVSMRPGSVALIDTTLRHFAVYLTEHHPELTGLAGVRRTHIEGFKTFLAAKTGYRGKTTPAKTTIAMRLSNLQGLFDRIIEWDYDDAPPRNPIFAGDMPIRDRPLPKFLDDGKAAALLNAARNLPDLFDRVAVEVLARTGLRKGEFIGLTRDAITEIGDGRWLRTPIGKLHTDRYIPLHPRVKELLQQWLSANPPLPHSTLMFTDRGRAIPSRRVDLAVYAAAAAAGIGHVTPHQLRHTLATQAKVGGIASDASLIGVGDRWCA